ncbi:hypothetical protein C2G38_1680433 [Gigaspora rosea]|uniref:Uncharacterized protein n=1 Tax=Gigaspora rosea TaxID=44941 RepID=A0A397UXL6_9GLOM|nr:hypothetical protein C2G38_1680433 [Gigaspora rosea]
MTLAHIFLPYFICETYLNSILYLLKPPLLIYMLHYSFLLILIYFHFCNTQRLLSISLEFFLLLKLIHFLIPV